MAEPNCVAIVVDREFGTRLVELAERMHVWVCDSSRNRLAVESVWHSRRGRECEPGSGATVFDCPPDTPGEDALIDILGTVDEHHPEWSAIEVIGCSATARVREAFAALGAPITHESSEGFEARRQERRDWTTDDTDQHG